MDYHRRSIRLSNFDYAQVGYYFVTIDVEDKLKLFWNEKRINQIGQMVEKCWRDLENRYEIGLDEWVVMPDHLHGIIKISNIRAPTRGARTLNQNNVGAGLVPALDQNKLGDIIGAFKSITTDEYIKGVKNLDWPRFNGRLWQRNFYERIIQNEEELERIRKYIRDNPNKRM